ncbi:MAG: uncharacterized protein KVP18_003967 [Porospora cf. gigantea A]|uniref:uncharacterized protein n=1 Tax=Porospora cf. gigantea A TaxID=2853593 RepID=UPI003559F0FA|nr:MAG: hypothetical protein KVP18_003967 [Porospora cf. gigantea A]
MLQVPFNALSVEVLGSEYVPYSARPAPLPVTHEPCSDLDAIIAALTAEDQVVLDEIKFKKGLEFFKDFPTQTLLDLSRESWLPTMMGVTRDQVPQDDGHRRASDVHAEYQSAQDVSRKVTTSQLPLRLPNGDSREGSHVPSGLRTPLTTNTRSR